MLLWGKCGNFRSLAVGRGIWVPWGHHDGGASGCCDRDWPHDAAGSATPPVLLDFVRLSGWGVGVEIVIRQGSVSVGGSEPSNKG